MDNRVISQYLLRSDLVRFRSVETGSEKKVMGWVRWLRSVGVKSLRVFANQTLKSFSLTCVRRVVVSSGLE